MVAAMPMPMALLAAVVTARVGQVPSTRQSTGFSLMMPLVNSRTKFIFAILISPFLKRLIFFHRQVDRVGDGLAGNGGAGHSLNLAVGAPPD